MLTIKVHISSFLLMFGEAKPERLGRDIKKCYCKQEEILGVKSTSMEDI